MDLGEDAAGTFVALERHSERGAGERRSSTQPERGRGQGEQAEEIADAAVHFPALRLVLAFRLWWRFLTQLPCLRTLPFLQGGFDSTLPAPWSTAVPAPLSCGAAEGSPRHSSPWQRWGGGSSAKPPSTRAT